MTGPWQERLRGIVSGRRFVIATDVLAAASDLASQLRELGADGTLCISGSRGVGDIDPEDERDAVMVEARGSDLMGSIRAWTAVVHDPPEPIREAVDRFDPDGEAWAVQSLFGEHQEIAGRPVFGARPPEWVALEDKTVADAVWDASAVTRAPSRVLPVSSGLLREAARDLDEGRGTVWVADNRLGWHGGAQYLRWVRGPDDVEDAVGFFAAAAHRVRVMPFLDGIPCSIHGMVFDDHVATFRPCEMIVLRRSGTSSLYYAGPATSWEPPDDDRDHMRRVARSVGDHLDRSVGYRGVFTVDGVMTAHGFRPTELNPRFGGAINVLARGTGLPLYLLHLGVIERPDLDWRPEDLEAEILSAADAEPVAQAGITLDRSIDGQRRVGFVERDGTWVETDDDPTLVLELGPGPTGGYLRIHLPDHPVGAPVAPEVVRALAVARDHLDLEIPDLEAAPDLRSAAAA